MRRMASTCGCQRESQGNSMRSSAEFVWQIRGPYDPRQVSGVFLLPRLRGMRRVLGEKLARTDDRFDPSGESMRENGNQVLQRPVLEAAALVEAVVGDVAKIGFRLLHHGHVQEHAGLADLVV